MTDYKLDDFLRARDALRAAAHMPPETFSARKMAGMLCDEIEKLRQAGHDDAAIAEMLKTKAGVTIAPEVIKNNADPANFDE